ncbi:ammonium transporter [Pseudozyma hubeiensis SY62]|uniref:Ammonium transporter n=1 Tax=Pseudozyma hubeiensis (strain SY62) TaxID=1305764 RepID=R9PAF9_PSEHS|nr:ammonium transporter [Pseudozyma hubeiensis SY62]GAC95090.1 ammonium transporter [Pseudozyma hubeiensis SY62]
MACPKQSMERYRTRRRRACASCNSSSLPPGTTWSEAARKRSAIDAHIGSLSRTTIDCPASSSHNTLSPSHPFLTVNVGSQCTAVNQMKDMITNDVSLDVTRVNMVGMDCALNRVKPR